MTKILGLDLGTNSIGWAVVDKEGQSIIDCGVRIFPEGLVKDTIGQGDKEVSNNAARREHRQARRQHYRKRLRKVKLLQVLIDLQMCPLTIEELKVWKNWNSKMKSEGFKFPDSQPFRDWLKMNPYELRTRAVNGLITRMELGRIFFHFIQRRGFLSSRKGSDDGAIYKGKDKMTGITATQKLVGNETLGVVLNKMMQVPGKSYERKLDQEGKEIRIRSRYTLREMYIREFEEIWNRQASSLGLHNSEIVVFKKRYFEGLAESGQNKKRYRKLLDKYGRDNVTVRKGFFEVRTFLSLKEYFAGNIIITSSDIRFNSSESLLFWQRPLRSQKGLLAKCSFEGRKFYDQYHGKWIQTGPTPCPLSHPDYELYRAYQFINNIRYGKSGLTLNESYRLQVLKLINENDKNFDFEKIPKTLKLTYEQFNYDSSHKVPGNITHKRLMQFFSEELWQRRREEIWHDFYFYQDKDLLTEKLMKSYGLEESKARKASEVKLTEGYGSVSLKAVRNILPFLKQGYVFSTAVILGGVKNAFGSRWEYFHNSHDEIIKKTVYLIEKEEHKEYELIKKIKEMLGNPDNQYGFTQDDKAFRKLYHHSQDIEKKVLNTKISDLENLRNPIVQKGLFEMRRLVNALLEKYRGDDAFGKDFRFDRIQVELARDLKSSKSIRQDMLFKIMKNEKENDEAREKVIEFGLKPSRENITKYRLFREIEARHGTAVCPYTLRTISVKDLLGRDNLFQIEHIIPYSISLDDGFANKTLCESNFNREKGEKTPYEFYLVNNDPKLWKANSWEEIEQRTFAILPYNKARRFNARKKFASEGFIERQLNDTRYISKKATEILSEICDDVRVLPGQLTAELRRLWGLNNVVQEITPLNLEGIRVYANESVPHYVILDENQKPVSAHAMINLRPDTIADQILLAGKVNDKGEFEAGSSWKNLGFHCRVDHLSPGRYWAKIRVAEPLEFNRVFTVKPDQGPDEIIYKGKVERGIFVHDSLPRKLKTNQEDGSYWVRFKVGKVNFVRPEPETQPATRLNQVLLYGIVIDNQFKSYIYQCECNLEPGKYWAVLDIEFESAEYTRAVVTPPSPSENEIVIQGSVNESGLFTADIDPSYIKSSGKKPGKYFTILEILRLEDFHPIVNQPPEITKDQTLVEGNVWVNRQTGEIMFDPKKNREDQRHHAVDAIVIAFTELSNLQRLSHYFGALKARERGLSDRPDFPQPWPGFGMDVSRAVGGILVSYSRNSKVLTKISKVIMKDGKKYQSIGFAARGRLHREYYFGRHPKPVLKAREKETGELLFETDKHGSTVYYYHIRKPISSIENHKHVQKIVDEGIKNLITGRLRNEYNIDPDKAYKIPENFFFDREGNPLLLLPNKGGGDPVPVRKVRMRELMANAVQLKKGMNQWVNPYNNHHVVIYLDHNGELKESIVTFWEVIERMQQGQEIYQLPNDGKVVVTTLQENDMFLLNLPEAIIETISDGKLERHLISRYLYRVQKISSMYYTFRHHLASSPNNENEEYRIQSFIAWQNANPIKIWMNELGEYRLFSIE
ncbi:MAG TPA: HNH endonuclease domain-containing protein [Bacteroidales bacterium]|nr:HNH endonuclease domain-containing protein [Bacteroidales bacterium]